MNKSAWWIKIIVYLPLFGICAGLRSSKLIVQVSLLWQKFNPPSHLCDLIEGGTRSPARSSTLLILRGSPRMRISAEKIHPVASLRVYSSHVVMCVAAGQMHFRSAEEGVRARASVQPTENKTVPVKGASVLMRARRLPTGGARTKANIRAVQIQSLVMQKSWDRLSGLQTNEEPS